MMRIMNIEIRHRHLYFRMYMNKVESINWFSVYVKRPLSTRSCGSSSVVPDRLGSIPPTWISISSDREIPTVDRNVS